MKKIVLLTLMALLTLGLVACGGSDAPAAPAASGSGPTTLDIDGQDIAFSTTQLTANANNLITVNFNNVGALEHNWMLVAPGTDLLTATEANALSGANSGILQGGQSVSFTFDAPPAGEYDYVCTVPGHAAAGMVGKLTIR